MIGDVMPVQWLSGGVTDVRIEISHDDGDTWGDIVASTPASAKTYSWLVSGPASSECLVRVSDAGGGDSDVSVEPFGIYDVIPFLGEGCGSPDARAPRAVWFMLLAAGVALRACHRRARRAAS